MHDLEGEVSSAEWDDQLVQTFGQDHRLPMYTKRTDLLDGWTFFVGTQGFEREREGTNGGRDPTKYLIIELHAVSYHREELADAPRYEKGSRLRFILSEREVARLERLTKVDGRLVYDFGAMMLTQVLLRCRSPPEYLNKT